MKHLLFSVLIAVSLFFTFPSRWALEPTYPTVPLITGSLWGKNVRIFKIVTGWPYLLQTSVDKDWSVSSLDEFMEREGAIAWMNGVFYRPNDPAYAKYGKPNTTDSERIYKGDGKSYSRYRPDTGIRGIIWVDAAGKPRFVQNNKEQTEPISAIQNEGIMDKLMYGLGNFPILVKNGVDMSTTYSYEISLDPKMLSSQRRSFICITKDQKTTYLGFVDAMKIMKMPEYLKKNLGCWRAINLDAWASIAMYHDEQFLLWPGRDVMDAFVIVPREGLQNYITNKRVIEEANISGYAFTTVDRLGLEQVRDKVKPFLLIDALPIKQNLLNEIKKQESSRKLRDNRRMRAILRASYHFIQAEALPEEYNIGKIE